MPTVEELQTQLDETKRALSVAQQDVTRIGKERDSLQEKFVASEAKAETLRTEFATKTKEAETAHKSALKAAEDTSKTSMEELRKSSTQSIIHAEARAQAAMAGMRDPADAARMLDMAGVAMDKDGKITGLSEAMTALKESKGYLFAEPVKTDTQKGTTTQPTPPAPAQRSGEAGFSATTASKDEVSARARELGLSPGLFN